MDGRGQVHKVEGVDHRLAHAPVRESRAAGVHHIADDARGPLVRDRRFDDITGLHGGKIILLVPFRGIAFSVGIGVAGLEVIDTAFISDSDIELQKFYEEWKGLMNDIKLNCYVIKTSSTGSELKIICKDFNMV